MTESTPRRGLDGLRRRGEAVSPLELFFDLVFVLAITQCSALMESHETWAGLAQGLLVLGVLWWAWVGYAWETSVVDPDNGLARIVVFVAMAGVLVVALCVPGAFGEWALVLALAYGVVRAAQIALFVVASRGDPTLRASVTSLGISTAIGVGLLVVASFLDGPAQGACWALALALDMAGPFFFGAEGWQLQPAHFAERHGLIVLIALGESIVALGAGSEVGLTGSVLAVAVLGVALAAAMWWTYFDVTSVLAARWLAETPPGKAQNELARDAYSYLHFPIVAGIVLIAVGLHSTLAHVGDPLHVVPAVALVGGLAVYLGGQVAFKYRVMRVVTAHRAVLTVVLLAAIPVALVIPAWATLAGITAILWATIGYETRRFASVRDDVRGVEAG